MARYNPRTGALETYQVGPFDSAHLYVQWGGTLPGNETWSCGFRMWKAGGASEADANSALPAVSAALAAFHARLETHINSLAKMTFVKVNAIGTDGHYLGSGTVEATYAGVSGGSVVVNGSSFPNQIALACTLLTGFNRGPAHKGRFFLPMPVVQLDANGTFSAPIAGEIGGSCNDLRTAVNTSGLQMVVMSRKSGAPGHRAVTDIEVGRVPDTQRRRRRSLIEDYQ